MVRVSRCCAGLCSSFCTLFDYMLACATALRKVQKMTLRCLTWNTAFVIHAYLSLMARKEGISIVVSVVFG